MSTTVTVDQYTALIPPPNSAQPKFMAWVGAKLQLEVDVQNFLLSIIPAFDINNAVGVQLDIIGQLIGVSRIVPFQPSDSSSPVLSDDLYKMVLQAKILQNRWKGTIPEIYAYWQMTFPDTPILIEDGQDMTMKVLVIGMAPGIQQDLVSHGYFVPKPSCVKVNYIFADHPIFAWGIETTYLKGWGEGYWPGIF